MSGKAQAAAVALRHSETTRTHALRWGAVNALLFAVFAYDLSVKCPGYTSVLHGVEVLLAGVLLANAVLHAGRLIGAGAAAGAGAASPAAAAAPPRLADADADTDDASVSLSPRRWRAEPGPPSPPSPATPPSPAAPDRFIADRRGLADYLRSHEERSGPSGSPPAPPAAPRPPPYQLAVVDSEGASAEEGACGAEAAGEARSHPAWRRAQLDPQRLDDYIYNLRLWLHLTILQPLVRELDAAGPDAELSAGQAELRGLLPYLQPFADRAYAARRIRELATGGCLSAFRWDGGGAEWAARPGRPADAELLAHLFGAYAGAQLGAGGAQLRRLARSPPHFGVALGGAVACPPRGRANLFHCLLLPLLAQPPPPHLGPAGLNMLWIVGR